MKESDFFKPIKTKLDKKNEEGIKPLTFSEYENDEEKPMEMKDYWLSLRRSIQDKLTFSDQEVAEEEARIKLIKELLSNDLISEYKEILQNFNTKTQKNEKHPAREFIDINSQELSSKIEAWIDNLVIEVNKERQAGLDEDDTEELRAQCWLFFDSASGVMNTRSLEKDIKEFYQDKKINHLDKKENEKEKKLLIKELQDRYPLDKVEVEILVDLVRAEKFEDNDYSVKLFLDTMSRLWQEYKLREHKGKITKISFGYLMSRGASSFAPSLFQNIIDENQFNVAVFLQYFGLGKLSEVIDAKTNVELVKVINEVNKKINERITNSLFFQEFEFIHEKSLGEIYATLEKGKNSTEQIIQGTISRLAPTMAGTFLSLAFLAKINPILGGIGAASLPLMYTIAKKQNKEIKPIYEQERKEAEKISTHIASLKSGFEEVRTSPESSTIAEHTKEQMNKRDSLYLNRRVKEIKMRLKRMIPFDVSTVVAAGVGGALQSAGMISGGAVLSNIIYSNQLNRPMQDLVQLYFNEFARYTQDIQRMEEILGSYEKIDLPQGQEEENRLAVSELKNFDIVIDNLQYKDILKGINLKINQGEFIVISGASGAGKSTLLRNLAGLYKPNSGEVRIGGVRNDKLKKYGQESLYSVISYCNQSPQIFEEMTLRNNLLLWSKKEIKDEEIKKVLKDLHLDKFIDKLDKEVKHLSGGEKVRIGLARTLIKGAKIMLLDEPTASLDSTGSTEVRKIIGEISKKYPDTTIICVSHDEHLIKQSKRSVSISDL